MTDKSVDVTKVIERLQDKVGSLLTQNAVLEVRCRDLEEEIEHLQERLSEQDDK